MFPVYILHIFINRMQQFYDLISHLVQHLVQHLVRPNLVRLLGNHPNH